MYDLSVFLYVCVSGLLCVLFCGGGRNALRRGAVRPAPGPCSGGSGGGHHARPAMACYVRSPTVMVEDTFVYI
jgi:hypothetical protein